VATLGREVWAWTKGLDMRVSTSEGTELAADFDLEWQGHGADLVLHSRSGSKSLNPRNPDYFQALEEILRRLGMVDATVAAIHIDSAVARKMPSDKRLLPLSYPIRPAQLPDIAALRREITRSQRTVATTGKSHGKGGNNHKRIRISIDFGSGSLSAEDLLTALEQADPSVPVAGRRYIRAKDSPTITPAGLFTVDPAVAERGLAGHASTQNALADLLRSCGREPFSPGPGEPDFDLAWKEQHTFCVVEVKSLTGTNATQQLRLGLGQVLDYREELAQQHVNVLAVLALEAEPPARWPTIAAAAGVRITWPPAWAGLDDLLSP
jgi:hypothetical protein